MTVEERMKLIDNKVARDISEEERKRLELERKIEEYKQRIRSLKPRIDDVIKVGNYAQSNGINMSKSGWGGHEGYDTGLFYSNGWSHILGFIKGEPIRYLGIVAGGACGNIDFYTDGEEIIGIYEGTKEITDPLYGHLERFVNGFDTFEEEFYKFIDKVCK